MQYTHRSSVAAPVQARPAEVVPEQQQHQQPQQQPMNTLPVQQPPYPGLQHTPSPGSDPRVSNLATTQPQHEGGQFPAQQFLSNNGGAPAPTQPAAVPAAVPQQQPQQQQQPPQAQPAAQQGSDARVTRGKYTLADFELLRTLGTGSFGRVHLVQSNHNHRFYAIKVLKKAQVVKMKQVEHTNDERKMLGEVKHPFLITLWGTFQDPRNLYMVMDFVEGGELFSLLRRSGVSYMLWLVAGVVCGHLGFGC